PIDENPSLAGTCALRLKSSGFAGVFPLGLTYLGKIVGRETDVSSNEPPTGFLPEESDFRLILLRFAPGATFGIEFMVSGILPRARSSSGFAPGTTLPFCEGGSANKTPGPGF